MLYDYTEFKFLLQALQYIVSILVSFFIKFKRFVSNIVSFYSFLFFYTVISFLVSNKRTRGKVAMIYGIINTNYTDGSDQTELVQFNVSSIINIPGNGDEIAQLKNLRDGDKVVTTKIQNLELPNMSASDTYQMIFNTGADIIILNSPALSSEIFKNTLIQKTRGTSVRESELIISAVTEILNFQIEAELTKKETEIIPVRQESIPNTKPAIKSVCEKKDQKIVITKKEVESKKFIRENLIDFGGTMTNNEIMAALHLARNSYYKYKKKVALELDANPASEEMTELGL